MGRKARTEAYACMHLYAEIHLILPDDTVTWASAPLMETNVWHSFLSILRLKCVVRTLWSLMISGRYCKALRRGSCRETDISTQNQAHDKARSTEEASSHLINLLCHHCITVIIYLTQKCMQQWMQCLCIWQRIKGSVQILQGDSWSECPQSLCHAWLPLALFINC